MKQTPSSGTFAGLLSKAARLPGRLAGLLTRSRRRSGRHRTSRNSIHIPMPQ